MSMTSRAAAGWRTLSLTLTTLLWAGTVAAAPAVADRVATPPPAAMNYDQSGRHFEPGGERVDPSGERVDQSASASARAMREGVSSDTASSDAASSDAAPVGPERAALRQALRGAAPRLQAIYAAQGERPLWTPEGLAALIAALETLDADGLTPADYHPATLRAMAPSAWAPQATPAARARLELLASHSLLTALDHLRRGKVDPRRLDPEWTLAEAPPHLAPATILAALAAGGPAAALEAARPTAPPYRQLRRALARYRHIARLGGWPVLEELAAPLRPGDSHPAVARLRERLAMIGELEVMAADVSHYPEVALHAPAAQRYDAPLVAAVRRFQARHLLAADGVVGPATRAALNVPVAQRIRQIRANLERARWLLHDLPASFVLVDIAGYRLHYYRPDGQVWAGRIIVGRPYRRTPSLRSRITHFTLNPTWTVPPTILRDDVLPALRRDPGYLARHDMQVLSPDGQRLDPAMIDWRRPGNVLLRQRAGPHNPLGRLVIRFPNEHLVYLHDTPAQGLFRRPQRALSSGCIRVEGVAELAQRLLEDTGTPGRVAALIGAGRTRNLALARPVPVVLHYWTVQPDAQGLPAFRPDIYARDAALLQALDRPLALGATEAVARSPRVGGRGTVGL